MNVDTERGYAVVHLDTDRGYAVVHPDRVEHSYADSKARAAEYDATTLHWRDARPAPDRRNQSQPQGSLEDHRGNEPCAPRRLGVQRARRRGVLHDGAGTARYLCEVLRAADSLAMTLILLASICEALKVAEFVPADPGRPSLAFTAAVIIDTNGP